MDWREIAHFYLDALFAEINQNINLSVLDGGEVLHIIRIRKKDLFPYSIRVGARLPAHCTAMGKVLLAFGKPEKTDPIVAKLTFAPLTHNSINNSDGFHDELSEVRRKGFAVNYEEVSMGICSVAAPVKTRNHYAVAAVSIVVAASEYSRDKLEAVLGPKVIRAGDQISKALLQVESSIIMDD